MTRTEMFNKSRELEKELISKLLVHPEYVPQITTLITDKDFSSFQKEFSVLVDCVTGNKNIATEFSFKKLELSLFLGYSPRQPEIICRDIKNLSNGMKLHDILSVSALEVPETGVESFVSDIQKKIITEIKSPDKEKSQASSLVAEWKIKNHEYKERFKNPTDIIGTSTGYPKLDKVIDGLRPEHLWIIGGYTNVGKTAASLNIVANLIKNGKRVVYYSIEMTPTDIVSRLLGVMTEQNGTSVIKGFDKKPEAVAKALEQIQDSELSIYSTKSSLSEIQFSMYEESLRKSVDLFVVDFVQLVTVRGAKSEYETITTSALEFQQTAKRLKAPIMLLSQISNEGARNGNDVVMSFKGSGALAAAADLAIEISIGEENALAWKDKISAGLPVKMKWQLRKNRHGRTGYLDMLFDGPTGIFSEHDPNLITQF